MSGVSFQGRLPQPHAPAAAVLGDELDAGRFKRFLHSDEVQPLGNPAPVFITANSGFARVGASRQPHSWPSQQCAADLDLLGRDRHSRALLSRTPGPSPFSSTKITPAD